MTDPINWGVVSQVAVPVIVAALTALGYTLSHRAQKGSRENTLIDQMQEMIKDEREAREKTETAMRGDITNLQTEVKNERLARENDQRLYQSGIRVRDGYISHLRHHIDSGKPPPAPEWPPGFTD